MPGQSPPDPVSPSRFRPLAQGRGPLRDVRNRAATTSDSVMAIAPHNSHGLLQSAALVAIAGTAQAEIVTPPPTPIYINDAQPARPAMASRSMTSEEPNTMASAPAMPLAKRNNRKGPRPVVNAIAPVLSPLTANAPSSQRR